MKFGCAILIGSILLVGCTPRSPETQEEGAGEGTFAEQAAAVRAGLDEQIRLERTLVTDADLAALNGLEDKLTRLNLSRTEISDAGMAQIARLKKLQQLRLASGRATDEGLRSLESLSQLRHLHLIDMPVKDAGLAHLHGLKSLQSLYIDAAQPSDEGIAKLKAALPDVHLHVDGGHHRADPQAEHTH